MPKDEDAWVILEREIARIREEIESRPKFTTLTWWQRLTHKHSMMFDGWVGLRHIERCKCGYGRVDNGRWFKF